VISVNKSIPIARGQFKVQYVLRTDSRADIQLGGIIGIDANRPDAGATNLAISITRVPGRVGGRRRVMTEEVVERCRRMLGTGATRRQVADVIGADVKTIYKYLPAT
jgi:hypothetical protein